MKGGDSNGLLNTLVAGIRTLLSIDCTIDFTNNKELIIVPKSLDWLVLYEKTEQKKRNYIHNNLYESRKYYCFC